MSTYPLYVIVDLFVFIPKRAFRLWKHLWLGLTTIYHVFNNKNGVSWWWLGTILMTGELFGLIEWYELGNWFFKWNTRPLTQRETRIGQECLWQYVKL